MTTHFKLSEFACKSGAGMSPAVRANIERLAKNLQVLRDEVKMPIRINSGHRSEAHNKAVGGAVNSQHVLGTAADIVVVGMAPSAVAATIERLISQGKMEQGGLKAYSSWTHYDCRLVRARW